MNAHGDAGSGTAPAATVTDPELAGLLRFQATVLVPAVLDRLAATHRDTLDTHDRCLGRPAGTTAGRFEASARELATATDGTTAALLPAANLADELVKELRARGLGEDPAAPAVALVDDARSAYSLVWRSCDVAASLEGVEIYPEPGQNFWDWRTLAAVRLELVDLVTLAARFGAGAPWGLQARLVALGVPPHEAHDTVAAALA